MHLVKMRVTPGMFCAIEISARGFDRWKSAVRRVITLQYLLVDQPPYQMLDENRLESFYP